MALLGTLNGTKVLLRVLDTVYGGYRYIHGEMSNSATYNNQPIDITSKYSLSFRELMATEGLQTLDVTTDLIFNDDAGFDFLKDSYLNKAINIFQIIKGDIETDVDQFNAMVTSWAETSPDNDKATASVTLTSSSAFVTDLSFEAFLASTDGQFFTANNEPFYVRNP